jgi:hypothetical protein
MADKITPLFLSAKLFYAEPSGCIEKYATNARI